MDVRQENENYYITNLNFVYRNCHCFEVCEYCTTMPAALDTLIFKLQYKRSFDILVVIFTDRHATFHF